MAWGSGLLTAAAQGPETSLWGGRCWTYQEAILAREFVFLVGGHRFLPSLREQVSTSGVSTSGYNPKVEILPYTVSQPIYDIEMTRGNTKRLPHNPPLRWLLKNTSDRVAGDPRDKIYNVLGVMKTTDPDLVIPVDYSKSKMEVVLRAAVVLLKESKTSKRICLENFLFVRPRGPSPWPSWLPDITMTGVQFNEGSGHFARQCNVERIPTGWYYKSQARIEKTSLFVRGLKTGSIAVALPAKQHHRFDVALDRFPTSLTQQAQEDFLQWRATRQASTDGPVAQDPEDTDFEVLALQRHVSATEHQGSTKDRGPLRRLLDIAKFKKGPKDTSTPLESTSPEPLQVSWNRVVEKYDTAQCTVSDHGFVGLSALPVRSGDTIAILLGMRWPVILRQSAEMEGTGRQTWELFCEAWIPSMTHDRVVPLYGKGEIAATDFEII